MTILAARRTLAWDWYAGAVPANVVLDESCFVETTYSFLPYRSEAAVGAHIGRGASLYGGTAFDVGRHGRVQVGDYTLLNGVRFICERLIDIGSYCLLSWNVLLMDCYRMPLPPDLRLREMERLSCLDPRIPAADVSARPIRIADKVWIGFEVCVLPGVTIGEGSIIAARSVVAGDVPPYTLAAGNPALVVRALEPED